MYEQALSAHWILDDDLILGAPKTSQNIFLWEWNAVSGASVQECHAVAKPNISAKGVGTAAY